MHCLEYIYCSTCTSTSAPPDTVQLCMPSTLVISHERPDSVQSAMLFIDVIYYTIIKNSEYHKMSDSSPKSRTNLHSFLGSSGVPIPPNSQLQCKAQQSASCSSLHFSIFLVLILIQLLLLLPAEKHFWMTRTREEDDFFKTAVVVVACRARRWWWI